VLVASVVLAAGVAVVLESLGTVTAGGSRVRRRVLAERMCADALRRYAHLPPGQVRTAFTEVVGGVSYRVEIETEPADAANLRRARCRVSWYDRGREMQVELARRVLRAETPGESP
jgi:hypothetical protein